MEPGSADPGGVGKPGWVAQDLAVLFLTVSRKLLEVDVYGSVQKVGLGSGFRKRQRDLETELVMETVVKEAMCQHRRSAHIWLNYRIPSLENTLHGSTVFRYL